MIIGISGKIHSGKDTVAILIQSAIASRNIENQDILNMIYSENFESSEKDLRFHLTNKYNEISQKHVEKFSRYKILKFKKPIVEVAKILTGLGDEYFENEFYKDSPIPKKFGDWILHSNTNMTPRELLQRIGHDAIVLKVHKNAWINSFKTEFKKAKDEGFYSRISSTPFDTQLNIIISDVRTIEHCQFIKENNGIILRVESDYKHDEKTLNHPVEKILDKYKNFDYIIKNNYLSQKFPMTFTYSQILKIIQKI
jgi:dephospho-CoA kinase